MAEGIGAPKPVSVADKHHLPSPLKLSRGSHCFNPEALLPSSATNLTMISQQSPIPDLTLINHALLTQTILQLNHSPPSGRDHSPGPSFSSQQTLPLLI